MLATGMLLHERYSLGWPLIHQAIALNPELFMDPLDEADGATGFEERWLAVYDEPRSASVGRLTELPILRVSQRVFLVSLSEAIRLVRRRANRLGLALPEPGQWSATLEAYRTDRPSRCDRQHLGAANRQVRGIRPDGGRSSSRWSATDPGVPCEL